MSTIFIINNGWLPKGSENESHEVVGGSYFTNENDAWDALRDIAVSHNVELKRDEDNFIIEGDNAPSHLVYDEYYIEELTQK